MIMSRSWAMPNSETFSIPPISEFVKRYLRGIIVDPFARNSTFATYTNDMNIDTHAQHHMDAELFITQLRDKGILADVVLFDPPYSPRQISECYRALGIKVSMEETQNSRLYKRVRDAIRHIINPGAVVLSFGWNSVGMGKGFEIEEILLVSHGGAHNDTICMAERLL